MRVSFFDHYWLLEMFEEIFLRRQYSFETDSARPLVVDVGSNIGLSILYFKRRFPDARVIGFEPDPRTFDVLVRNVRENGLQDVTLVNEAVYDGEEWVYLYGDEDVPGSPQVSTRRQRTGGAGRAVPATRLSEHVTESVDYLKLDVEGAEHVVLAELEESGKLGLVERMGIEYHHHVAADEDELSGLLALLERNGFGYQLEARLDGSLRSRAGGYQNIFVFGYRKSVVPPPSAEKP